MAAARPATRMVTCRRREPWVRRAWALRSASSSSSPSGLLANTSGAATSRRRSALQLLGSRVPKASSAFECACSRGITVALSEPRGTVGRGAESRASSTVSAIAASRIAASARCRSLLRLAAIAGLLRAASTRKSLMRHEPVGRAPPASGPESYTVGCASGQELSALVRAGGPRARSQVGLRPPSATDEAAVGRRVGEAEPGIAGRRHETTRRTRDGRVTAGPRARCPRPSTSRGSPGGSPARCAGVSSASVRRSATIAVGPVGGVARAASPLRHCCVRTRPRLARERAIVGAVTSAIRSQRVATRVDGLAGGAEQRVPRLPSC